jgi:hypothetical protein
MPHTVQVSQLVRAIGKFYDWTGQEGVYELCDYCLLTLTVCRSTGSEVRHKIESELSCSRK